MAAYIFRTIDRTGAAQHVTLDAASEHDAIEMLKQRGLILLGRDTPRRLDIRALLAMEIGSTSRLSQSQLTNFTREIASMLRAGLDLERSLRFASEMASSAKMRVIIERLRDQVRDGAPLARAVANEPASFPPLYVGLIRAGEEAGSLANTLERLAELWERNRSLRGSIMASLTYPVFLLITAIGAIFFLLTNVLPEFVPIFVQNGVQLPRSTAFLLAIGSFFAQGWPYLLLAIGALIVVGRAVLRQPGPRLQVDYWLLATPVMGNVLRDMIAARFNRTLGTLLENGVALVPALAIVEQVMLNRAAALALRAATEGARRGQGLARGLETAKILPVRTIHLIRLGEETGQLGAMALRAAAIHEERARQGVERLVSLMVPLITIAMGAAIGFIVASLLLAMLGLNALAH
jgi:general secretion pathway protein F